MGDIKSRNCEDMFTRIDRTPENVEHPIFFNFLITKDIQGPLWTITLFMIIGMYCIVSVLGLLGRISNFHNKTIF